MSNLAVDPPGGGDTPIAQVIPLHKDTPPPPLEHLCDIECSPMWPHYGDKPAWRGVIVADPDKIAAIYERVHAGGWLERLLRPRPDVRWKR